MKKDILIIGAGAAGLIAMKELLHAGYHVCLLEAAPVAGGRIATVREEGFATPVETGAEFVHGELPLTLSLLDQAGIAYTPLGGSMIVVDHGKWQKNEDHDPHWNEMMRKLARLPTDMSMAAFLKEYFNDNKYASLRDAVQHFAQGFDLADVNKVSALACLQEWGKEEETQYRLPGGYVQLVDYLLRQCRHEQAELHFNCEAIAVNYTNDGVTVTTADNRTFTAAALLITVSAGALQSGSIDFSPAMDTAYSNAIAQLGFGSVIKILMAFRTPFWNSRDNDIGFLLSSESIPTWWTQSPNENNLLTGWLGGPPSAAAWTDNDSAILQSSLQSLSAIFGMDVASIEQQMVHYRICRWHQHPYAKGGYSYVTVESANAKKILAHPLNGNVFFAGEAVHRGQSQGTVEAALQSGLQAAKSIQERFV